MKIATGTVSHGKIVVDQEAFAEGEKVTIVSYDNEATFSVTAEEKRLLRESLAQAGRGEIVDADELLAELEELN